MDIVHNQLYDAIKNDNKDQVKTLVSEYGDRIINEKMVVDAIKQNRPDLITILMDAYYSDNYTVDLNNIIYEAISNNDLEMLKLLSNYYMVDKSLKNEQYISNIIAHISAPILRYLIKEKNIDPHYNNDFLFKESFKHGNIEVVKLLLEYNINKDVLNEAVESLLNIYKPDKLPILQLLMTQEDVNIHINNDKLFIEAVEQNKDDIVDYLLKHANIAESAIATARTRSYDENSVFAKYIEDLRNNNIESFEDAIWQHDRDIYKIIVKYIAYIPDFTTQGSSTSKESHDEKIWRNVHTELTNIGLPEYSAILQTLEANNKSFYNFSTQLLTNFISSFPTMVWILLLQPHISNAFRLLIAADRLDFIKEGILLLTPSNDSSIFASIRRLTTPPRLTKEIIKSIRSMNTAIALRSIYEEYYTPWTIQDVKNATKSRVTYGISYYIALYSPHITFDDWNDALINIDYIILDEPIAYVANKHKDSLSNKTIWIGWVGAALKRDLPLLLKTLLNIFPNYKIHFNDLPSYLKINTIKILMEIGRTDSAYIILSKKILTSSKNILTSSSDIIEYLFSLIDKLTVHMTNNLVPLLCNNPKYLKYIIFNKRFENTLTDEVYASIIKSAARPSLESSAQKEYLAATQHLINLGIIFHDPWPLYRHYAVNWRNPNLFKLILQQAPLDTEPDESNTEGWNELFYYLIEDKDINNAITIIERGVGYEETLKETINDMGRSKNKRLLLNAFNKRKY